MPNPRLLLSIPTAWLLAAASAAGGAPAPSAVVAAPSASMDVDTPADAPATDALDPSVATDLEVETWATNLELVTSLQFLPDGRAVITEKTGRVLVRRGTEVKEAGRFDVDAGKEKGLLTVVAHPRFQQTPELFFYYSAKVGPDADRNRVVGVMLGKDGMLDRTTERVVVSGLQGPDDHEQGGGLAIGPDENLYVGVGDTGCRASKPPEPPYTPKNYFSTCLTHGNGKILRVHLDGSIPKDNPLALETAVSACGVKCGDDPSKLALGAPRKDIWVWGVRNPWRIWFDPTTKHLWVGDVGDTSVEEIDVIPPSGGLHYGWPWREGPAGHPPSACQSTKPDRGDCVDPAYACVHGEARDGLDGGCKSMNGGLILDDCRWPQKFRGLYYFGDNANGRVWTLQPTPDGKAITPGSRRDFGRMNGFVVDMDRGPDGGLYLSVMSIPPKPSRVLRIAPKHELPCAWQQPGAAAPASSTGVVVEDALPQKESGVEDRSLRKRKFRKSSGYAAFVIAALIVIGIQLLRRRAGS